MLLDTYDYRPYNETVESSLFNSLYGQGNCVDQVKDCAARGFDSICESADAFCAALVESVLDNVALRDEYDVRELQPDPFPYSFYVQYLNTPKVQKAIGAYQNFSESSNAVYGAFTATGDDDREIGTTKALKKLLDQGIYVLLYAGDADYKYITLFCLTYILIPHLSCNWLGGEVVAHEVGAIGFESAGYTNITSSDGLVHGQVKQAESFSFARIYESGHEVPFYQPLVSLELFERTIKGLDIATGTLKPSKGYLTNGTAKSEYREGNSTVQFEVLPKNATYNYTTGQPEIPSKKELKRRGAGMLSHVGKKFKF